MSQSPDLGALAEAVWIRRDALGISQAELAARAGCSTRFIHTLEHAKPSLRLDKVLEVLAVLELDLEVRPGRGQLTATWMETPDP
jgi:predicted transcriptional regulator